MSRSRRPSIDALRRRSGRAASVTSAVQDLPISITAISGRTLEQAGIEDVAELAHTMAGVDYTDKGPFSAAEPGNLFSPPVNYSRDHTNDYPYRSARISALWKPNSSFAPAPAGGPLPGTAATLYVNNVTNTLGVTSIQDPALFGNRNQSIISRPRTVGLTVAYQLKER